MTKVSPLIQSLVGPSPLKIGMKTVHPKTGKRVKIINGQYWGEYGLSNFWEWRNIRPDGTLGRLQCGYGWKPLPKGTRAWN